MKKITPLTFALLLCLGLQVQGQSHRETQSLVIDVDKYEEIHFYNKHGEVNVRGVDGTTARIDGERKLRSKSKSKLEQAKAEIYLDTFTVDNALVIFINNPFYQLEGDYESPFMYYDSRQEFKHPNIWKKRYVNFEFDVEIEVPRASNLTVATHSGDLKVSQILGLLSAKNHHDDVTLEDVSDLYHVHTHHGDIKVSLTKALEGDIDFDTHHGDITVSMPSVPSAEIHFDSHHGDFYTDFDWRAISRNIQDVSSSKRKTKYKLGDKTLVQMGDGDHTLTFDTHHGDMYLLQL